MGSPVISLSLDDYDAMRASLAEERQRSAKLAADLDLARACQLPPETVDLKGLIRASVPAMAHAVANLGAEISAWPVDAVRAWAAMIDAIAGVNDGATREMAIDLRAFANECEKANRLRGK